MVKRFILTTFFCFIHVFMPFVIMSCNSASDAQYVYDPNSSLTEAAQLEKIQECKAQEFLTEDCVAILQADNENSEAAKLNIFKAFLQISNLSVCKGWVAPAEGAEETDTTVRCEDIVRIVSDGVESCENLPEASRGFDCREILKSTDAALSACESGQGVTEDFCSLFAS